MQIKKNNNNKMPAYGIWEKSSKWNITACITYAFKVKNPDITKWYLGPV